MSHTPRSARLPIFDDRRRLLTLSEVREYARDYFAVTTSETVVAEPITARSTIGIGIMGRLYSRLGPLQLWPVKNPDLYDRPEGVRDYYFGVRRMLGDEVWRYVLFRKAGLKRWCPVDHIVVPGLGRADPNILIIDSFIHRGIELICETKPTLKYLSVVGLVGNLPRHGAGISEEPQARYDLMWRNKDPRYTGMPGNPDWLQPT